jgi:hypothetical protein
MRTTRRQFTFAALAVVALALAPAATAAAASPEYTYRVRQDRAVGGRDGKLTLTEAKVEYRSDDGEHGGAWSYRDIQRIEVLSPTRIRITTYEDTKWFGKDRAFTLDIVGGELTREVSDFLRARSPRPFVTSFVDREGAPIAEIGVKHNHRLGGCQGVVAVYDDHLVFEASDKDDSRTWLWADITGVSRPDAYRLELATRERQFGTARTFTFTLKEPISDAVYGAIWERVYRPAPLRVVDEPHAEHHH